jgi:hypothetical protein
VEERSKFAAPQLAAVRRKFDGPAQVCQHEV